MHRYSPNSLYELISPHGRWFIKKLNQSATLYTTNLGSRLRFIAKDVNTLTVNVLDNRNPLSPSQIYAWRIDGNQWHRELASHRSWHIECGSTNHLIEIITAGNTDLDRVWNGNEGFAITSIDVKQGDLISASIPILPMIPFSQTFAESIRSLTKKHKLPLIETLGWCSSFTDDLHPDQSGATESGYRLAEKLSNWLK